MLLLLLASTAAAAPPPIEEPPLALARLTSREVAVLRRELARLADPCTSVRPVLSTIARRVASFGDEVDDFVVRKTCMSEDAEVLAFQRKHPKLYWLVTDRALMRQERYRNALGGLLGVRDRVESGALPEGQEADATATSTVMAALNHPSDRR